MSFLAVETGGTTHFNSNDILDSVATIFDQQAGYYLLTFEPAENAPANAQLRLRLKRPNLRISYRKTSLTPPPPAQSTLLEALASPFFTNGIPLKLLPLSNPGSNRKWQLSAVLHIDCSKLIFKEENGQHSATIRIISVTEGDLPLEDATTSRSYTIRASTAELSILKANGLIYSLQSVAVKPGPYQIRAAVLDTASQSIGAVSTFIEIPELNQSTPALSSIEMTNGQPASQLLRTFSPAAPIGYSVTLYNGSKKISYKLEPRILYEDKVVWTGKQLPVNSQRTVGSFTLGTNSSPGEYILQIIFIPDKPGLPTLTNWVDFEIIKQ